MASFRDRLNPCLVQGLRGRSIMSAKTIRAERTRRQINSKALSLTYASSPKHQSAIPEARRGRDQEKGLVAFLKVMPHNLMPIPNLAHSSWQDKYSRLPQDPIAYLHEDGLLLLPCQELPRSVEVHRDSSFPPPEP